ncbi:hypothetical protein QJQ45_009048 [Haematococcus lacustris]|nr:hypothetical protein QJQ45_009048 [Haematococcus lacustris]
MEASVRTWSQRFARSHVVPLAAPGCNGIWVDRDCNTALNLQRVGEAPWRPLELSWWPHRAAAPALGKEYPAVSSKKLQDRTPKA